MVATGVDVTPPTSRVQALPTFSPASFTVTWTGSDTSPGSGLKSFDVYVKDGDGAWTLWQSSTTQTSAVFTAGQNSHVYSFYSVATDVAGNVEATSPGAQASTTVDTTPPTSSVAALPTFSIGSFNVAWSGSDGTGPGVAYYNVYVSVDGGTTWRLWQNQTTQTSATYVGSINQTYGFYSIAVDQVGNVETKVPAAEAQTSTPVTQDAFTEPAGTVTPPSVKLATRLTGHFVDPDRNARPGVAVIAASGNGSWQYSGGAGWINIAAPSRTSALLLSGADSVRFRPAGLETGPAQLLFVAWDGSGGLAGRYVSAANLGSGTPFSTAASIIAVNVTPVLHAPVWLARTATLAPVPIGTTSPIGQTVAQAFGSVFSGAGDPPAGIAVTGLGGTRNGTWLYDVYDSAAQQYDGWQSMVNISATQALLLAGQDQITFVPTSASFIGMVTLQAHAWNGSGTDGGTANLRQAGTHSTAFSAALLTAQLHVNAAPTQSPPDGGIVLGDLNENMTSTPVSVTTLASERKQSMAMARPSGSR